MQIPGAMTCGLWQMVAGQDVVSLSFIFIHWRIKEKNGASSVSVKLTVEYLHAYGNFVHASSSERSK